MAGLRDAEVDVVLKTISEGLGEYAKNIAAMIAMREEARRLNDAQSDLANGNSLTRRELERLEPSINVQRRALRDLGNDYRESRRVASDLGATMGFTGREFEKFAVATLQAGDSMPAINNPMKEVLHTLDGVDNTLYVIGRNALPVIIAGLVALAAVIAPLLVLIGSWLVVTTTLVVALGGFLTLIGLATGAVVALAAGILALGIAQTGGKDAAANLAKAHQTAESAARAHTSALASLERAQNTLAASSKPTENMHLAVAEAQRRVTETAAALATANSNLADAQQKADGPLPTLIKHFQEMANVLGKEAAPQANLMILAADQFIPRIQQMGENLIKWFGPQLPSLLMMASHAFSDLLNAAELLGPPISAVISWLIDHRGQVEAFFNMFLNLGVQAVTGLLGNLIALSNWFLENWQPLMTITGQGLDVLGQMLQGLASAFASVAQSVIDHWPQIVLFAQPVIAAIGNVVGTVVMLAGWLGFLAPLFDFLGKHTEELTFVLTILLMPFAAIVIGIILLIGVLIVIISWMVAFVAIVRSLGTTIINFLHGPLTEFGSMFSTTGRVVREVQGVFERFFNWLGPAAGNSMAMVVRAMTSGLNGAIVVIDNFIRGGRTFLHTFGIGALDHVWLNTLASGGVVDRPTLALVGEGGGPEVVIPTEPSQRGRGAALWAQAGEMLGMGGSGALGSAFTAGLGASWGMGAVAGSTGGPGRNPYPGGQCTWYVYSRFPGMPVDGDAWSWAGLPLQHLGGPRPGAIVVYSAAKYPPFGHVAVTESGLQNGRFLVSEMNFVGFNRVDQRWSDMSGISAFLNPGVPGVGGPPGALFASILKAGLTGIMNSVLGGVGGWSGDIARSMLGMAINSALRFDTGGIWPNGTVGVNTSGRSEHVSSGDQMDEQLKLLASIDSRLADMGGRSKVTALAAQQRIG